MEKELIESKKPWQSKTNWVALLIAASSFFPLIGSWVQSNPDSFMQIVAGLFMVLRYVTKGKISIK